MTSPDETQASASTLRRAYLTIERMQHQLEEYERSRAEPIAIVGLGCRFAGGVVDAETYWKVLGSGTDAIGDLPADRWDVDAFYAQQPRPGKMTIRSGGFLDRIDEFDHEFFGISRREAVAMDPQQRLALEVAWEALENAGQSPAALAGSQTGVFAGVFTSDFALLTSQQDPRELTAYTSAGSAHSAVPGRIPYALDLNFPSLAIDTACSSSLVAIHLAAQSLRSGESDLALSGGVSVIQSPITGIGYSQLPGFVAAADGSIPSEGCAFIVLKRLSDAIRDDDQILAVVRGEAVNQDGRSSGFSAPNGLSQRDVLRRALDVSGVEPHEVSYVEVHGSGTQLGDAIEAEALAEVYGRDRGEPGAPVFIGTAKTNIGHSQAAAGIAGVIKVVLAMAHGLIPAHLNFRELNPGISFEGTTLAVPTELTPWPVPAGQRIAGVSSFGFSGTNAHVILAEAPERPARAADARRPLSLLALSARNEAALVDVARRYAERLSAGGTSVADVCFSANTGRSHFTHRLAAVAGTAEGIADKLADFVAGIPGDEPVTGRGDNADVVFLFTGQGSQRVGMARDLYATQPTFRQAIDQCDEILRPVLQTPLISVLYPSGPDSGLLDQATYAQPALFAIEYAVAQLWRSWGLEPAAVIGHSLGEYVAACVAGAMTLEDGLKLVAERGRLTELVTGTMATVFAPEDQVVRALADHGGQAWIAAVNGPAHTVISGVPADVVAVCGIFAGRDVRTRQLHVTGAGHCDLVEPILAPLRQAAAGIRFAPPRITLISNVTGEPWPWDKPLDADYWCAQARQPVRFADGVATLRGMGYRNFLEVGPTATLLGLIRDGAPADDDSLLLPSLRSRLDDWPVILSSVAQLYVHGADLDWRGFDRDYARARVVVPTYPFARTSCGQAPRYRGIEAPDGGPDEARLAGGSGAEPGESDDEDLLYQLDWQRAEAAPAAPAAVTGPAATWLVLADDTGVGAELAAVIAQRGSRCVRVVPGTEYRYDGTAEAVVRLDDHRDLTRLLQELDLQADASLRVVHLWALSGHDEEQDSAKDQLRAQEHACLSAVRVVQAVAQAGRATSARLWLVTRGAAGPGPLAPALSQSVLWGLGRSLQQEHAGIWGGLIDLDPGAALPSLVPHLVDEIENRDGEDQIALRGHDRYVARLVRAPLADAPPRDAGVAARGAGWRKDASYLITGGLTGIGLAVARSLVLAGARRLVLVGRTPIPPRGEWAGLAADHPAGPRVAAIRELESLGASVLAQSLDISDEDQARAFLERFDQEGWPPIRGVVHSAGVGAYVPVLDLTPDEVRRHLRPKSVGAWVLHRLFADRPLDFFVLFSSGGAILSSPFYAAYAAANAFVDALAQFRRGAGKPALSIDWGLWQGTGLDQRQAEVAPGLSRGMGTIEPARGVRVFHQLLRHDQAQVAVLPIDWSAWGRRYQEVSGSPVLATLVDGPGRVPGGRGRPRPSHLPSRATLLGLPAADRVSTLSAGLHLSVAAALGAAPAAVSLDQPLIDLGFDSLMSVELRTEIEGQLGVFLEMSAFLSDATVANLTVRIVDLVTRAQEDGESDGGRAVTISRAGRAEDLAAQLLAEVDGMSQEQARLAMRGEDRS